MNKIILFLVASLTCFSAYNQHVVDFEELTLSPESYWNGSDLSGSFTSKFLKFYNNFDADYFSWQGWAYSNTTDATTYNYTNQYSSATGRGAENSNNYAVCYVGADWMTDFSQIPSIIEIDYPQDFPNNFGMYVSLSTYTNLYMEDEFTSYESNNHWLKLHINGFNINTDTMLSQEFYLADYRVGNENFKMVDWTYIDMSWARGCDRLEFTFSSSDSGEYGINTPTYFCMDNFGAPEPISVKENIFENLKIFNNLEYCVISNSKIINKIEIVDVLGKNIKVENVNANSTEINISDLKQGVYLINIYSENQRIGRKIVK